MKQILNIEETYNTETEEVNAKIYEYVHHFEEREVSELPLGGLYKIVEVALTAQKQTHHHQLQKAREEERERVVKIVEKEAAETYVEMLGAVIDQHGLKVQDYTVINTAMIQHILTGTIGNLSTRIYKAIHSELDQEGINS